MQVVYSGGSSTPTPSPRLPRKNYGYGQPFLPGYLPGQTVPSSAHNTLGHHHHHHPHAHHHHHQRKTKDSRFSDGDASLRDSIPAMSKPVAILCLVCNILLPGLGTFVSGLTVLCCSQVRHKGTTKQSVVRVNSWVALLQFLTAFIFLLGWIWSVMWGAAFLSISGEYHKKSTGSGSNPADQSNQAASGTTSGAGARSAGGGHVQSNSSHRNVPRSQTGRSSHVTSGSAPSQHSQPMIVLQEPPPVVQPETSDERTKPILGHINPRQQRILRRQMSDSEFSPFQLTNQRLEDIIIHDGAPVPNGNTVSAQARGPPEVTKSHSSDQLRS